MLTAMYATCLFCYRSLGRNESVEAFPIGRRLAFDAEKGRLWVVCTGCARWNLTPLEERWEAIEQCERLFRDTRLRTQTGNIGLVRTRDGLELIRIGRPLRPELAMWRYGAEFARRFQRRALLLGGAGAATVAAGTTVALSGGVVLATQIALAPILLLPAIQIGVVAIGMRNRIRTTRIIGEDGSALKIVRADLRHVKIIPADEGQWSLHVQHTYGRQDLTGERARRALEALLTTVNRAGAGDRTFRNASKIVAQAETPTNVVALVAAESARRAGDFEERHAKFRRGFWMTPEGRTENLPKSPRDLFRRPSDWEPVNHGALDRLPADQRLALEMAASARRFIESHKPQPRQQ